MKCNVRKKERILRIILGSIIVFIGYYYKNLWGAIGIIPIITGSVGWCPAYTAIGVSTCKSKK